MTDTSATPAEPIEPAPVEEVTIPPEIQSKIDAIKADIEKKALDELHAVEAEEQRIAKLVAAKAVCTTTCGPVWAAIEAAVSPVEKALLQKLEEEVHEPHKAMLEAAHLEAAGPQPDVPPTIPGVVTPIASNVSVLGANDGAADKVGG